MGQSEDYIYEIFETLEKKNLKTSFFNQLEKMKWQDKHRYKPLKERYEYAFNKIVNQDNQNNYKPQH